MKQSLRKIFGAGSAVFLIGLFVTAAPVRAASTDERIKALAAELEQLKAEQKQVQQEQTQMKQDALAARSKLPSFRYRPGSGLRIRSADRSWEYRITGQTSGYLSFFPAIGKSPDGSDDEGPSQGSMYVRHQQWGSFARLLNGLYEFGYNFSTDREGGTRTRAKSPRMQVRFNTWSPYYPVLMLMHASNRNYSVLTRTSSTAGLTTERQSAYSEFLSTGSYKGAALEWLGVPVGPSKINLHVGFSPGDQLNARVGEDPIFQKGLNLGMRVLPFPKSKNKWLKGIDLRFAYVNLPESDFREDGDNGQMKINSRTRTNRVTFFSMSTNGRHTYIEPSINYVVGPFNIAYTWARNTGEQKRANKTIPETDASFDGPGVGDIEAGDAAFAGSDFSEARFTSNIIGMGLYLWGPKGFMSGSRNGGWRLSYVHNRMYLDAGSGFDADETANEFSSMRKWHVIENVIMLRWFQQRNLTWAIQYELNGISKMEGGGKAAETRRRANISATGGTYQVISLFTKWMF